SDTKSVFPYGANTDDGCVRSIELMTGYRWGGIYVVWSLDDFAQMELSTKSLALSSILRRPHKIKAIDLPHEMYCISTEV
ncbi:MAG: hypothetical protein ACKPKO_35965, partial [Candidatus Fonsibacter sp.]